MWIIQKARGGLIGPFPTLEGAELYRRVVLYDEVSNILKVEKPYELCKG